MSSSETRQDDGLTTQQAFYPLIIFVVLALFWAVILPEQTGAWSAESWKGYWGWVVGAGLAIGALLKLISYFRPKKK